MAQADEPAPYSQASAADAAGQMLAEIQKFLEEKIFEDGEGPTGKKKCKAGKENTEVWYSVQPAPFKCQKTHDKAGDNQGHDFSFFHGA